MATKKKPKSLKIYFSETRRLRALIFGMWHLIIDLYQVYSNYAPRVKTGPTPGDNKFEHRNKEEKIMPWGQNWPHPRG